MNGSVSVAISFKIPKINYAIKNNIIFYSCLLFVDKPNGNI